MAAHNSDAKLVVIVGETASGKSALAMSLAQQLKGEIICADSRTIYRGMNIGTAKPSKAERAKIPHHLLDVAEPNERFSAAEFKRQANQAIADISSRGKVPIMVGGSGLYIDAVLFDYQFSDSKAERDPQNPRHLKQTSHADKTMRENTLVLGLSRDRSDLEQRITRRMDDMLNAGLIDEIRTLADQYGWDAPAMQAPAYKAFRGFITGSQSLNEARADFIKNDLDLAKRQRTWFKRNNSIHWLNDPSQAVEIATTLLNKKQ